MTVKLSHYGRSAAGVITIFALTACTTGPFAAFGKENDTPAVATAEASSKAVKSELSMEQIIARAKGQGYTDISEIEREGGRYCVEALDQDGKRVEVFFDARTGETIPDAEVHGSSQSDRLSIDQIIAKAKEQGYSDISEVEREGDKYCIEARDAKGEEVEIFLDAKTGERVTEEKKKAKDTKDAKEGEDLSKDEIIAKLKEQGYPEVSKIERERESGQYWAMATDADGKKFELHVDARTGDITRKEKRGE